MKKRIISELKWIESYFLFRYNFSSYIIRQKSRILFWAMIVASFLFGMSLFINLNSHSPNYFQAKLNGFLIILSLFSLFYLRTGNYYRTVFVIYLFLFAIWVLGYIKKLPDYFNTGINSYHYHLFALISFSVFFGNRKWLIISSVILALINGVVMYIAYSKHTDIVFNSIYKGIHVNTFISIIFSGILLYMFSELAEMSLKKTERELKRNQILNQQLENKVQKKTKKITENLEELKIMNVNLRQANNNLKNAQITIMNDMNMAANVQKSFLSAEIPIIDDWEIALEYIPMSKVSGDFYDFYIEDKNLLGFSLFDVSGHGVSSALITMVARSIIFHNFRKYQNHKPGHILQKSNEQIKNEIGKVGHHLTGILFRIKGDTIEYSNAAHTDIIIGTHDKKIFLAQAKYGRTTGTFLGLPGVNSEYNSIEFKLNPGEVIIAFTDGLVEANLDQNYNLGIAQLIQSLQSIDYLNMNAKEIQKELTRNFYKFTESEKIRDDATLIILKHK